MSGSEFVAIWATALAVTALIVGWAFAVQAFGLPVGVEVSLGVGVPIAGLMGAMWFVVRQ